MRVALTWSLALGILACAAPLAAQEAPVVTGAEIDAALSSPEATAEAGRAAVRDVLGRPEVAEVADRMGIDPAAAQAAVANLDGAPLARAAGLAADIERALAGGETFSINATMLIIVLLLIVLVVIIAD